MNTQGKLASLLQAAELLSRCELDADDFEEYAMNVADAAMRLCGYRMSARENAYVQESEVM